MSATPKQAAACLIDSAAGCVDKSYMHFLITGGAGFIGSHLAERLLGQGDRVTVLDDLSTGRAENLARLGSQSGFQFVRGSVEEESTVNLVMSQCDAVFHLASAVGVQLIV